MKKAIKKAAALIGMGLSLLALLIVVFILVKGWGLRTPLKEGVSTLAGVAEQASLLYLFGDLFRRKEQTRRRGV
jgi:hypothetical protein